MAIKTFDFVLEDVEGNPHQYTVNQLGAMQSFQMLQKLAKSLGTAGSMADGEIDGSKMGMAIVGAMGDDKVYEVIVELLGYKILRDDKKLDPDTVYTGNLSEMIEVILEMVKINYGHLFKKGKLASMVEKFQSLKS